MTKETFGNLGKDERKKEKEIHTRTHKPNDTATWPITYSVSQSVSQEESLPVVCCGD